MELGGPHGPQKGEVSFWVRRQPLQGFEQRGALIWSGFLSVPLMLRAKGLGRGPGQEHRDHMGLSVPPKTWGARVMPSLCWHQDGPAGSRSPDPASRARPGHASLSCGTTPNPGCRSIQGQTPTCVPGTEPPLCSQVLCH